MATYKVIQDVEAEDKLLGPLTLRQFIYAFVAGVLIFLSYFTFAAGAGFMVILFLPFIAVSVFFAFPWSHEQSTEVWALARIGFLFKPRRRVWDQSGYRELVTVTAPKRLEQIYTDGLSQIEVRSRLNALANTLDSRGWATKNNQSQFAYTVVPATDDRLVSATDIPVDVPAFGSETYTDILDPTNNTVAQQFDTLLNSQAQAHHQQLINSFNQATVNTTAAQTALATTAPATQTPTTPPVDYWFLNDQTTGAAAAPVTPLIIPGQPQQAPTNTAAIISSDEEQAIVENLKQHEPGKTYEYSHLPKILPLAEREKLEKQQAAEQARIDAEKAAAVVLEAQKNTSTMTDKHDAAILGYAGNNDLSVETIARQAKKAQQLDDDEVVISLH